MVPRPAAAGGRRGAVLARRGSRSLGAARRAPARAQSADAAAAKASLRYLAGAQNDDGGWGGAPGQSSTQLHTGWTALGLAAAGRNPRDVGGTTAIDFTRAAPASSTTSASCRARSSSSAPPGSRRATSAAATSSRSCCASARRTGASPGRVNTTAFAAMALKASGGSPKALRGAGRWIAGQANPDGGFNFAGRGGPSGIDDTGAAIQGLVAAGRKRTRTVKRAARFLVRRQNADGGFPLVPGGASNAQSTAWAIQGLLAAGRDPAEGAPLARPARLPALAHVLLGRGPLLAHQPPDAGLGDRAGRDGAGPQAAAAEAGRPRAARPGRAPPPRPPPPRPPPPERHRAAPRARQARRARKAEGPGQTAPRRPVPPAARARRAAARAVAVPADARRAGYVAGLAAFAVL